VKLLGFAIAWAGYTLMWWGWSSLQGPGVGIMDLVIPGRVPRHISDSGAGSGPTGATAAQLGGPLGVGTFLPGLSAPSAPTSAGPLGAGAFIPSGPALTPQTGGPLGQGLFLPGGQQ
jgi:hypothetical protein